MILFTLIQREFISSWGKKSEKYLSNENSKLWKQIITQIFLMSIEDISF